MKYRIIKVTHPVDNTVYLVEKYVRCWYAPWKFHWIDAIKWDDCIGIEVPYFYSLSEAKDWIKLQTVAYERNVVYEE